MSGDIGDLGVDCPEVLSWLLESREDEFPFSCFLRGFEFPGRMLLLLGESLLMDRLRFCSDLLLIGRGGGLSSEFSSGSTTSEMSGDTLDFGVDCAEVSEELTVLVAPQL